jgi:hypothetical protein
MDLDPYITNLRHELAMAAEAGGEDARALADRLTAPLESAARLALLEALSGAADEITRELAPGSVHVRLRGREPAFVVTPPPAESPAEADTAPPVPSTAPEGDEGATARINFRLGEHLKSRIEEAAGNAGLSVNSWLVRAATAALDSADVGRSIPTRPARGSQRFTGWVR